MKRVNTGMGGLRIAGFYLRYPVICDKCGKVFEVEESRLATAKYCSRKCCYPRIKPTTAISKFKYNIDENGCWMWKGVIGPDGYSFVSSKIDGRGMIRAHIISYEHFKGPIPKGYHIDHLCLNKACVNPEHLEAVTPTENTRRYGATRTHCKNGHALTSENVFMHKGIHRRCRACGRMKYHKAKARKESLVAETL